MYKITEKRELAKDIKLIGVEAPHITYNARAGNFVVVITDEKGERVPLTIYDWDREKGIVYIVFMEVGASTKKLGLLDAGDYLYAIAGPFGKHFHIERYGNVVIIGGGVGTPAIFPIARELKKTGNKVISIIGYRTKDLLILENEMKSVSDEVLIATNDGSYGEKGLVTDILQELIDKGSKIDLVIAVGPIIMMKAVSDLTRKYNLRTIVSLNAIMIDATGMCGGCRVTVGGETKFACVDGPDFDGHLVDFNQLLTRMSAYKDKEQEAIEHCRLNMKIQESKNG